MRTFLWDTYRWVRYEWPPGLIALALVVGAVGLLFLISWVAAP